VNLSFFYLEIMLKVGFIVFLYIVQVCVGLPVNQSVKPKVKTTANPKELLGNLQRLIEGLCRFCNSGEQNS